MNRVWIWFSKFSEWALAIVIVLIMCLFSGIFGHILGKSYGYAQAVGDYRAGNLDCIIKVKYPHLEKK